MAWITPDLTLCQTRLTGSEWTALSSAALKSGQTADAVAQEVIDTQVSRIRGRVAACQRNILGAAGTIPDELTGAFLALWVYEFVTRIPAMKGLLDDLRVKSYETAVSELRAVAKCELAIVPPETPADDDEQAGGQSIEVVTNNQRWATREKLSGLF